MTARRALGTAGMTLFEVMVALAILVGVSGPLLERLGSYQRARQRLATFERLQRTQSHVLDQLALLPRGALDRLIGRRQIEGFDVVVDRPNPRIYRIEVKPDSAGPGRTLVTLLFRERGGR